MPSSTRSRTPTTRSAPIRVSIFHDRLVSKLRNRVIGRVFHDLGLPPLLEEIGSRFRVTLRTGRVGEPSTDPTTRKILSKVSETKGRLTSEIAKLIGLTPRATHTRLAALVGRGLVRELGSSPQDPQRRYFRAVDL